MLADIKKTEIVLKSDALTDYKQFSGSKTDYKHIYKHFFRLD